MKPGPSAIDAKAAGGTSPGGEATPFRFYDNRQKYLAFVTTMW